MGGVRQPPRIIVLEGHMEAQDAMQCTPIRLSLQARSSARAWNRRWHHPGLTRRQTRESRPLLIAAVGLFFFFCESRLSSVPTPADDPR